MPSKADRPVPFAIVLVRRLLIQFVPARPRPATRMNLPTLSAFVIAIASWAVVAGLVWLSIGLL